MGPGQRRLVVFGAIVSMHAAAIFSLALVRADTRGLAAPRPIAVRMISLPEPERATPRPIEVKVVSPTISIAPPEIPIIDLPAAEHSPRAITVPMQVSAPVEAQSDRSTPKLISTVEYVREPSPRYPTISRKLREQGLVTLRVIIDEQGNACSIEIENSSGYARLDHAARDAVARAAFRPYVEDGEPRRAVVIIPIEFYLNRSSA